MEKQVTHSFSIRPESRLTSPLTGDWWSCRKGEALATELAWVGSSWCSMGRLCQVVESTFKQCPLLPSAANSVSLPWPQQELEHLPEGLSDSFILAQMPLLTVLCTGNMPMIPLEPGLPLSALEGPVAATLMEF